MRYQLKEWDLTHTYIFYRCTCSPIHTARPTYTARHIQVTRRFRGFLGALLALWDLWDLWALLALWDLWALWDLSHHHLDLVGRLGPVALYRPAGRRRDLADPAGQLGRAQVRRSPDQDNRRSPEVLLGPRNPQ